jgi:hypothetical protein
MDSRVVSAVALLAFVLVPATAHAQQNPKFELRGIGGIGAVYLDEDPFPAVGVAARVYVTRRLSVEPEIVHFRDATYPRTFFLGKVAWDLGPRAYVMGGVDLVRRGWTVGVGWRLFLTDTVLLVPEISGGTSTLVRATFGVGYLFRH